MRRLARWLSTLLVGTLSLSTVVAAQSENRALVDSLELQLLAVAVPLTLAVLSVFAYTVYRFRDTGEPSAMAGAGGEESTLEREWEREREYKDEDESESGPKRRTTGPGPGPALEISWTLAAVLVLLFVGVTSYSVLASSYVSPDQSVDIDGDTEADLESLDAGDDTAVHVQASQWDWNASYPETDVTTRNEIVILADENVTIWLTSDDVVHSLFVPELGVKQDAFPGEYTRIRTIAYEPGAYDVRCTEFCGSGHAEMTGTVVVLESEAYEAWLSAQNGDGGGDGHDEHQHQDEHESDVNATAFLESD